MFCENCGEKVEVTWRFCTGCGHKKKLNKDQDVESQESPEIDLTLPSQGLKLSKGATESLTFLKKAYTSKPPKERKGKSMKQELTIGVQVMDKDGKMVRVFRGEMGITGILKIPVLHTSCSEDWERAMEKKFHNITFRSLVWEEEAGTYIKAKSILGIDDLEMARKAKKLPGLRAYMMAEGKDRKQIKAGYRDDTKTAPFGEWLQSKKRRISSKVADQETEKDEDRDGEDEDKDDFKMDGNSPGCRDNKPNKPTNMDGTPPGNMKDGPPQNMADQETEKDEDRDGEDEDKDDFKADQKTEEMKEKERDDLQIDAAVAISLDDFEEDMELAAFNKLQARLNDRQETASRRIEACGKNVANQKQFIVLYKAYGYNSLCVRGRPEAKIDSLYDMICAVVEGITLAPKFHLEDETGNKFSTGYPGTLGELPRVLYIVEEVYNPDDTLTNYDEVIFN